MKQCAICNEQTDYQFLSNFQHTEHSRNVHTTLTIYVCDYCQEEHTQEYIDDDNTNEYTSIINHNGKIYEFQSQRR